MIQFYCGLTTFSCCTLFVARATLAGPMTAYKTRIPSLEKLLFPISNEVRLLPKPPAIHFIISKSSVSPQPALFACKPMQFPVLSAVTASLISVVVIDVILLRIKALKNVFNFNNPITIVS